MSDRKEKPELLDDSARAMKHDWDQRALENAKWYINTVKIDQSDAEFDASGIDEIRSSILPELSLLTQGRAPQSLRFLEIGCGIGRMTKFLAEIFGEVHSTDVSGEMIRRARQRLAHLRNVTFYETSGVDFAGLPDDYFDIGFSAYVFQHVPTKEAIRSNIIEAFRKLKPGGIFRFHTNGVESLSYQQHRKDTWAGATFTEPEIRRLAMELDARLISIYGSGTLYCWSTLRKKPPVSGKPLVTAPAPKIEFMARADDPAIKTIPLDGDQAYLSLLVSGMNRDLADANNVLVIFGERSASPRYVGRPRPHFEEALAGDFGPSLDQLTYIETGIPRGLQSGSVRIKVRSNDGIDSGDFEIELERSQNRRPVIVTVRNGDDYGTDLKATGPKSLLRLFVEGLNESAGVENVRVRAGSSLIKPEFVGYVTDIAGYQVDAQLPKDIEPGIISLALIFNGTASDQVKVEIRE